MKEIKLRNKIITAVTVVLIATFIVAACIYTMANRLTLKDIKQDMDSVIERVEGNYLNAIPMKESAEEYNNAVYKSFVRLISELLTRSNADNISDADLEKYCQDLSARNIAVINAEGDLLNQAYPVDADFTRDRFNQLKAVLVSGSDTEGFPVTLNGEKLLYYGYPLGKDRIVVLMVPAKELDEANSQSFGWSNVMSNAKVGIEGFSVVTDARDGTVIWADDESLIGRNLLYRTSNSSVYGDEVYTTELNGREYYGTNKYSFDAEVTFTTLIPKDELNKTVFTPVIFISLFFFLTAGLLAAFVIIQSEDDKTANSKTLRKKMLPVALVAIIFLALSSYYLETLCALSIGLMRNEANVTNIGTTIQEYEKTKDQIIERNDFCVQRTADIAAYTITRFPQMNSTEGLAKLAEIADCREIRVLDTEGRTVTASRGKDQFVLSENPEDQSYEFRRLLKGTQKYCQPAMMNDNGDMRQYAGVALHDANGDNCGLIEIGVIPVQVINAEKNYSFDSALSSFASSDNAFVIATDKENKTIVWDPSGKLVGKNAVECGIKESNFKDGFNGFITINNTKCFGCCKEDDSHYVFVLTPQDNIYKNRTTCVLGATLLIAILIMLMTLVVPSMVTNRSEETSEEAAEIHEHKRLSFNINQLKISDSGRKMVNVLGVMFTIIAVFISILYLFKDQLLHNGSVVKYVFDGHWEKGINPFSITACITLICAISVGVFLIRKMLEYLSNALDSRGVTMCKLISNFIYVFSIFAGIYFCLAFFGVDTSTLLASAGIMSVVIGLGANKMIGDILAGLAIVFDGSIKVGDIIEAGNFKGEVREIGIRSTKLIDSNRQLLILPNSDLGAITNISTPNYMPRVNIRVAHDVSIDDIRHILDIERDDIRRRNPRILDGPFVYGVSDVGSTGYEICFNMFCNGKYSSRMKRVLREELQKIFFKYKIKTDINYEIYVEIDKDEMSGMIYPDDNSN